ncbi:hypothetical protein HJC23_004565 [Cyclotella cryptica]|uniref:HSF-type DNA-binding domain-containing protein n=1 Tax=Cyclotella cryptica TaxID=29204 RepID=A0ABD3QA83_9STRA
MMSTHLRGSPDNSGLLHLMEAATALTQLVSAPPGSAPLTASSAVSTSPIHSLGRAFPNRISDDDDTMATNSKISMLRSNHLEALRAASLAAMAAGSANFSAPNTSEETAPSQHAPSVTGPTANATISVSSKDKDIFPMRLHALLADPTVRDVISWLPHGRSFVILRPDVFATRVLPRYFAPEGSNSPNARQSGQGRVKPYGSSVHKYPSFTRKLNRWGFRQISRGADAGAFCHELFRRDDPEACRSMMCQKSRKTMKDDCKSISSASTMSVTSGEKRSSSAAVTVSTSGTSTRSLPFKKRRGIASTNDHAMDIPANVEMKPNNSSLLNKNVSNNFDAETVSNISLDGSVCSANNSSNASRSEPTSNAFNAPSEAQLADEAAAKEALARHFHEQQRAFALASLMENSRLAMLARGLDVESNDTSRSSYSSSQILPSSAAGLVVQPKATQQRRERLGATTNSLVFAPTITVADPSPMRAAHSQHTAAAEAAKSALYEAYKKALSSSL